MSSAIYVMDNSSLVRSTRLRAMVNSLDDLADYVRRVAYEKRLSYREIAKRTGQRISHGTVSDIINRRSKDIKAETLKALAAGLGVTEEEIFAIARGKSTSGELAFDELRMLELYRKLSPEKRIEAIAHLEVAFQFQAGGHEPRRQPTTSMLTGSSKRSEKKRA